ncbi:MAG TPA: GTPase, partial [Anaerolineales bacterium]|nr:GTPase [Anaerolineales bacterium]
MGRPNVGKSTLLNALLGTKVAAVSPWPQTTRKQQMGILTLDDAQIIFVDTPGVHNPHHRLGERMNEEAASVLQECDLCLLVVDVSEAPNEEDQLIADLLVDLKRPIQTVMALNKSDLVDGEELEKNRKAFESLFTQIVM